MKELLMQIELAKEDMSNAMPIISNRDTNMKAASDGKGKKNRRRKNRKKNDAAVSEAVPVAVEDHLSPVQRLFDTCRYVFANAVSGIVPSPDKIQQLKAFLDDLKAVDMNLSPEMPHFISPVNGETPIIRYLHIFECNRFSMGIFCLPPSAVIPLHNHPGMTVLSKLLFGTMHIKSYDWVTDVPHNQHAITNHSKASEPEQKQPLVEQPEVRLAKVKVDSDFVAPCETRVLYPNEGGNLHCFMAVTACAVLDVLGPPYSDPEERPCTYFLEFPFANFSASVEGVSVPEKDRGGYAWLQERDKPKDLTVLGELY